MSLLLTWGHLSPPDTLDETQSWTDTLTLTPTHVATLADTLWNSKHIDWLAPS